jgi:hypothetical protein
MRRALQSAALAIAIWPFGSAWAESADDLAERALTQMQAEQWSEALASVDALHAARPTPVTAFHRARCLQGVGRWVEAALQYRRVIGARLGDDAPAAYTAVKDEARAELATLEARLPVVAFEIDAEDRVDATLAIDGRKLAKGRTRVVVDPGVHVATATVAGVASERRVTAEDGDTVRIRLGGDEPKARPVPRGRLIWGASLGAASLGLFGTMIYATLRLDGISGDAGYEGFVASLREPRADPCDVAKLGTPGVDYLPTATSHSRGEMIEACGDAEVLRTLQIVTVPSALVTGTLAAYLLTHLVPDAPQQVGVVPMLGPTTAGATVHWSF